jgi:hypothetical protein
MNAPKTISNVSELHAHLKESCAISDDELNSHLSCLTPPEPPLPRPTFCVRSMWEDHLNLAGNVAKVMWAEKRSREHPDIDDLRVRFINY